MSSSSASARQAIVNNYRAILKHCRLLPSDDILRPHVIRKFKEGRVETDKQRVKHLRALANQYACMVTNINELKHLKQLDSGEMLDPREKIRATAGKVGLGVPQFADEANFYNMDGTVKVVEDGK